MLLKPPKSLPQRVVINPSCNDFELLHRTNCLDNFATHSDSRQNRFLPFSDGIPIIKNRTQREEMHDTGISEESGNRMGTILKIFFFHLRNITSRQETKEDREGESATYQWTP